MVIGVGMNLAQRDFGAELADRATSVAIETGRAPDRDAMLATLLEEFDAWRWRLESHGFGPVRERWLALSETIGRRVTADAVSGLAIGLDVDGALLVDDGRDVRRIVAGEIAPEGEVRTSGLRGAGAPPSETSLG
jgi:BirA family biotin operon repressor/biotin-[acetyl-CoA-carboxylase] ligase